MNGRNMDRFWAKVDVGHPCGCWEWTGAIDHLGYGRFGKGDHGTVKAHRIAYMALLGEIPAGMELDHLCRNRRCVNPDHLEPVTHRENTYRGFGLAGKAVRNTECPSGHSFTAENTTTGPKGERRCRECNREYQRRHRERRKAAT